MQNFQKIGVVGAGAWGTALAASLAKSGRQVVLWARDAEVVASINQRHVNDLYLPEVPISAAVEATGRLEDLAGCDAWLWVVPVQYTRPVCQAFAKAYQASGKPVLLCSKGIETGSLMLPSAIVQDELESASVGVLSGPSFAREVAEHKPTAVTLAFPDKGEGMALCHAIGSESFRPYYSDDIIGAQIGGAIKNVIAIAAGIAAGSGMGDNARAALITRGLAEMMRLGAAMDARAETLMGLSGMGDLVLTCSSLQSRNMSLGHALGEGHKIDEILKARKSVAEGVPTALAASRLAKKHGVEMPITTVVSDILNEGQDVRKAIDLLLHRPLRPELE